MDEARPGRPRTIDDDQVAAVRFGTSPTGITARTFMHPAQLSLRPHPGADTTSSVGGVAFRLSKTVPAGHE